MRLSIPPNSTFPKLNEVQDAQANLKRELERAASADAKSSLLCEIGALSELGRDDHGAAKEFLAAVNVNSAVKEPLERLIALIERRRSFKNLDKLLNRLVRVANTAPEIHRAQGARGDFLCDHGGDLAAARHAYGLALDNDPTQKNLWLSLEHLGCKLDDPKAQIHALEGRAPLYENVEYRALLQMTIAELQLRVGEVSKAKDHIEQALSLGHASTGLALRLLRKLSSRSKDVDLQSSSAERLATHLLEQAETESSKLEATVLLMNAAELERQQADLRRARDLCGRAVEILPHDYGARYQQMQLAEAAGDAQQAAELAARLLNDFDTVGSERAVVALRLARAEVSAGRIQDALAALAQPLEHAPNSIPARALQLNLLQQTHDPHAYAAALEGMAAVTPAGPEQATQFLRSATAWAALAKDVDGSKAALAQARQAGASPQLAGRLGRMFAQHLGDAPWFREATLRLSQLSQGTLRRSLQAELVKHAVISGNQGQIQEALAALLDSNEGAWLSLALTTYVSRPCDQVAKDRRQDTLETRAALAYSERLQTGPLQRALTSLSAWRVLSQGRAERAAELLSALHDEDPADLVVTELLAASMKQVGDGDLPAAAEILVESATAIAFPDVAASQFVHAGVLYWLAGERDTAVLQFESAAELVPGCAALSNWALRVARPDSGSARRTALKAALRSDGSQELYSLERFALDVGLANDTREEATRALDAADEVGLGDLSDALQLARALWSDARGHDDALAALEGQSVTGREIARAMRFAGARSERAPEPSVLLDFAKQWAEFGSLPGILEWLGAALAAGAPHEELAARRALGQRLEGACGSAIEAGAAQMALLLQDTTPDLLAPSSPTARLTNLELAPPGTDPRRRARALSEAHGTLGETSDGDLQVLAGYNYLAARRYEDAANSFRACLDRTADDIAAWEGLRLAARKLTNPELEVQACSRLGELTSDARRSADYYRRTAHLLLDTIGDESSGVRALEQAVKLDISDFASFNRLFRCYREARRHNDLIDLCARRLPATSDAKEVAKLYWERARAMRALARTDEALIELENVRMLEPKHIGAMALSAEISLTQGDLSGAARQLANLAAEPTAPQEQRLMSGVAAVDLFDGRLNDLGSALAVLDTMQRGGLSTIAVKERLARATAKAERWQDLVHLLEQLMVERESVEAREEAARLAMAVYRDRLDDNPGALKAVTTLLSVSPHDGEAIELVLKDHFDEEQTTELVRQAREGLEKSLQVNIDHEHVANLARIAEYQDDLDLRQAALGVLISLGVNSKDLLAELSTLKSHARELPQIALGEKELRELLHPDDGGPIAKLLKEVGPDLNAAVGPSLSDLDVLSRQRVRGSEHAKLRTHLSTWSGAFGLGKLDVYVGGAPSAITSVDSLKVPSIVVPERLLRSSDTPLSALLAQHTYCLSRGIGLVLNDSPASAAALVVAACALGGHELKSPRFTLTPEFERVLTKKLSRRTKKLLPALASPIASKGCDVLAWAEGARCSIQRVGAIASGDVSELLLTQKQRTQGTLSESPLDGRDGEALGAFVLSPAFLRLRKALGMSIG